MTAPPGLPERAAHSRSFVLSLILLATLLAIACYSLLALQPAMADQRSQHELQNTGHLVLFGMLAFAACHSAVSGLKQVEFFRLLAGIVVLAAIAGLLTEYLQGLVGREPSIQDFVLDVVGATLGCTVYAAFKKKLSAEGGLLITDRQLRVSLGAALAATTVALLPLWKALIDEHHARVQFPVLANYQSALQMTRHRSNAKTQWQQGSLLVRFHGQHLQHLNWKYLARDWSGYRELAIVLTNRGDTKFSITCRVHDKAHEQSYAHRDRFNQNFVLQPGTQTLRIKLDEVREAPHNRQMNMQNIASLICFVNKQAAERLLSIEEIRLQGPR